MRKLTLDEVKRAELDILSAIDLFCEEKKIRYSLAYGTLLGCIRHKGFIPWDDDIDIWMPRPDYIRFVNEFSHEFYQLKSPGINDKDYYIHFAKVFDTRTTVIEESGYVWNIFLDIFPIDGLPDNVEDAKSYYKKAIKKRQFFNSYRNLMELTQVKPVSIKEFIVRNLTKLANVIYPCMTLRDKYVRFVSKYDFSKSMHCFDCAFGTNLRILQRGMVDTIIKGEFENKKYSIFASYDKLLRLIYGDYMQLPPVEEREPKHNFTAYMND